MEVIDKVIKFLKSHHIRAMRDDYEYSEDQLYILVEIDEFDEDFEWVCNSDECDYVEEFLKQHPSLTIKSRDSYSDTCDSWTLSVDLDMFVSENPKLFRRERIGLIFEDDSED